MDNWTDYVPVALSVVVIVYLLWMGRNLKDSKASAQEVAQVAEMAVLAAEEYGRTGKLATSEDKLRYAARIFRQWVPIAKGVSDQDMLDALHAFVPLANQLGAQITITADDPAFDENTGRFSPVGLDKPVREGPA